LIVEDDEIFRNVLLRALGARGYEAIGASDGASACTIAADEHPGLAVVDMRLPDANGLEVVRDLVAILPECRILVLTGYGSIATAMESIKQGAVYYLSKPADVDSILAALGERESDSPGQPADLDTPSLARVEWEHIQRVLADCDGNISEAARRLHMHRRSLQRKLAKRPARH
jgi:two-component system response regulator RegA